MCKLIRTNSGVLNLVLETEYVTEVFERNAARTAPERGAPPIRVVVLEPR